MKIFLVSSQPWVNIDYKNEALLKIPSEIKEALDVFRVNYALRENGRKRVCFIHSMSLVHLDYGGKQLVVSGEQALILLLFNVCPSRRLDDILVHTGLSQEHAERALKGLREYVVASSSRWTKETVFSLLEQLDLLSSSGLSPLPQTPELNEQRINQIKAVVCSVLKHNKEMDYNQISDSVAKRITAFTPNDKLIADALRLLELDGFLKSKYSDEIIYTYLP